MTRFIALLTAIATALLTTGCSTDPSKGYTFSGVHDSSIETVAVPIFQNDTFHTGVEIQLTEDLIKQIQRQTPWRVTSADKADAVLTGSITRIDLRSLSTRTSVGFVQEMGVQMTVEFEFIDNRSGDTLSRRTGYSAMGSFVPASPTGERIAVGYAGVAQTMARDIVGDLQSTW